MVAYAALGGTVLVVHASDIHLDSPMIGLERYEGCPVDALRGATRRALVKLCDTALEEHAELLLIAGDLYDGAWKDYATGLFFVGQMRRLREGGVRVVFLRGNHDAESQITKHLTLPDNVKQLPTDRAGTVVLEDLGVAIHGRGFPTREVFTDIAKDYPTALGSLFNIGLLHTALGGREGHEPYAPTTTEVLKQKGYDYWALGHVHRREVVSRGPFIVYPGNLQGRSVKETGSRGATFLQVAGGRVTELEHRAMDVVRWADLTIEADGDDTIDDLLAKTRGAAERTLAGSEGRLIAARLTIRGRPRAHAKIRKAEDAFVAEVRAVALDVGGDDLWLGDLRVETASPLDLDALRTQEGPIAHLLRGLEGLRNDADSRRSLKEALSELRAKLPDDLVREPELACLDDDEALREVLVEIEESLVARLAPDAGDE